MPSRFVGVLVLVALAACTNPGDDTGDPLDSDTGDVDDTGEDSDTEDSDTKDSDTGDTADSGDTGDTGDTGDDDTADTGDTADSGDTGDTADTGDTGFACGGSAPLDFCDAEPDASTAANWDFSEPAGAEFHPGFYVAPSDAVAFIGSGVGTVWGDASAPVHLVAGHAVPVTDDALTLHATVFDGATASARLGFRFYDDAGDVIETVASTTPSADGTARYAYTAVTDPDAAWARPFVQVTGLSELFADVATDDWEVTAPVSFDATDHEADPAERIATNPQTAEGSGGFFVEAALNDEAVLYVATQASHASGRDHFVFVWVGAPHTTDLVAPPWAKNGSYPVAAPGAGQHLFVLAREGTGEHFCGWQEWTGSAWEGVTTGVTCATGDPSGTPAAPRMEGTLDLPSAAGVTSVATVPILGFAAVPFDTQDGGNSWGNPFQTPYVASDPDLGIDDDEIASSESRTILTGGVPPEPFTP